MPDDEVRSIYLFHWVDSLGLECEGFLEIFPKTERMIRSPISYTFGWMPENVVQELLRYRHPKGFGPDTVREMKAVILDGMLAIVLADEDVQAQAC